MKKLYNHKQVVKSGKKGTASPCIILELMLASLFGSIQLQCTTALCFCRQRGYSNCMTTMPTLQPVMLLLLARMSIPTKQLTNPLQWQQMQMRRLCLGTELLQLLPQQLKVRYKPALRCFGPAGLVLVCSTRYYIDTILVAVIQNMPLELCL